MRSINIQTDIEAVLTQFARCIPDIFSEFKMDEIEVVFDPDSGAFDIVRVLDEDNEVVLGEITLDSDFNASFDLFEANELLLEVEAA